MASTDQIETNELKFCWEQVLRTNRLFRISQVFAPADRAAQLVPLYALFAAVEEVCSNFSEEEVARRKLDWWRNECTLSNTQGSDHPILRQLERTGALYALPRDSLERLFADAESRLDPMPPEHPEGLRERCRQISWPQFELELSLWGDSRPDAQSCDSIAAVSGLAQLMRETVRRGAPGNYWWLPLSLLARHGVSRPEISRDESAAPVQALFTELLGTCRNWAPQSLGGRVLPQRADDATRHLSVLSQLQSYALRRLRPDQPTRFAAELNRVGLAQLYQAWRVARQARVR
jgi:phytoene synthase